MTELFRYRIDKHREMVLGNDWRWYAHDAGEPPKLWAIATAAENAMAQEIERLRSNPRTAFLCAKCAGGIYERDACCVDGDKHYHAICYVTRRAELAEAEIGRLRAERDAVVDALKQRSAEWPFVSGSVADIVELLLFQKDQEAERLREELDQASETIRLAKIFFPCLSRGRVKQ